MEAINAKLSALQARLLKGENYRSLCNSSSHGHFMSQVRERMSMDEEIMRLRKFSCGKHVGVLPKDQLKAWMTIKAMPNSRNRHALSYIKGTEIDLENIGRIYRLKEYFPTSAVYPHIIPISYRINQDQLRQLAESPGVPEFIVALRHTSYGDISIKEPEKLLFQAINRAAKRWPGSAANIQAYFFAREIEIRNLICISEGLRFGLSSEEIYGQMILL